MLASLKDLRTLYGGKEIEGRRRTYRASKSEESSGHLSNVLLLKEIDGLEEITHWDTVALYCLQEGANVLHNLEGHRGVFIDLLNAARVDAVHEPMKA